MNSNININSDKKLRELNSVKDVEVEDEVEVEVEDEVGERKSRVTLWDRRMEISRKPSVNSPVTKQNIQWLVENALDKFGKEQDLTENDFTVRFVPELQEKFLLISGPTIEVLWGSIPIDSESFKTDVDTCITLIKKLLQPKSIDLQARINERIQWCESLAPVTNTLDNDEIRSIELYRLVKVTHVSGLVSSHYAPPTGSGSMSWIRLVNKCKDELVKVLSIVEESMRKEGKEEVGKGMGENE